MVCTKKWSVYAFLSLTVSLAGEGSEVRRVGLLWAENQAVKTSQKQKYLSEVKEWVENELGARLIKSYERQVIPLSVVHLEQKKQELLQYAQDSIRNESMIQRKMAQLPKGAYGPEIQRVKIEQAQFWWMRKKYERMDRLLNEARGLHPFGELVFPTRNPLLISVEWEVFESTVSHWLSNHPSANKCKIKGGAEKRHFKILANGFPIDDLKEWIHPGTFLFQWEDGTGRRIAQIVRCVGREEIAIGEGVYEKANLINRIDQLLKEEASSVDSYVLIVPYSSRFELFSYQKEQGLVPIPDWRKNLDLSPLFVNLPYQVPENKSTEWYNKKSTWWWLGGLFLAASAAYFVDGNLSQEHPMGWKVRIKGLP